MNFAAGSLNSKSPNYRAKYDDRKGLGYGLLEPVFDVPAIAAGTYPYSEPDNFEPNQEDQMSDEELDAVVAKVNGHYVSTDPYASAKTDPFSMVGGNRPVKPASNESSLNVAARSMVPFPDLYAKRTGTGFGGSGESLPHPGPSYGFRTGRLGTGSKQGFASSPPESIPASDMLDEPVDDLYDIPDSDQRTMKKLKKLISLIHDEQEHGI